MHGDDVVLAAAGSALSKRALVTGAAGGMGREIALQLAARGCAVGIADINAAGTAETANLIAQRGAEVVEIVGDFTLEGAPEAAVGKVTETARHTIDADGRVVCPGFVDPHTHYDAQLFWDPAATPSCFHGVTTVLGGT